jgi:hypothetical protein
VASVDQLAEYERGVLEDLTDEMRISFAAREEYLRLRAAW